MEASLSARQGRLWERWQRWAKCKDSSERLFKVAGSLFVLWALLLLFLYFFHSPQTSSRIATMSDTGSAQQLVDWWDPESDTEAEPNLNEPDTKNKTLVVYVYFEKNQLYKDNLQFFLNVGVRERDDIDFVFVVQGRTTVTIPRYSNVRVLTKANDCLDFGGWRHALDRLVWRNGTYSHFVFMNSSVRGPFLPSYLPRAVHWTSLFTQFITDPSLTPGPVKLVGLTINCAQTPHVQSMMWATDLEGLTYLIDETTVVTCKKKMQEAIATGELSLSSKIIAKGWNIAALTLAYQGWDFRVQKKCNGGKDPNFEKSYFGISPGLHETIFIKANRKFRVPEVQVYSHIVRQQADRGLFDGLPTNVATKPL